MPRIPLVGENYALRSPAAAAQQCLNLFPQVFDDPWEKEKNVAFLVGAPGYHSIRPALGGAGNLIKGLWSGGGRLFAVAGVPAGTTTMYELGIGSYVGGNPSTGTGTIISSNALTGTTEDGNPAMMFGDGNQLGLVKNGYFWINNGAGPTRARFQITGTVNTASTGSGTSTCNWVSGDQFPSVLSTPGAFITIDGVNFLITTYTSSTTLVLSEDAGTQLGATFTAPAGDFVTAVTGAYLDGYFIVQRPIGKYTISGTATCAGGGSLILSWASGDFFDEVATGQTITFNGSSFTVAQALGSPLGSTNIILTTSPGAVTAAFSAQVGVDLGRQFNISAPFDGTSWDPLDFATKEADADYIQSLISVNEQLIIFGTESMEPWQNTGDPTFPLQRIASGVAKEGSGSRFAPAVVGSKVYYLSGGPLGTPVAYRLDGFIPVRISTHAEEAAWANLNLGATVGYAEVHDGHQFWVINMPNTSWVFDATASALAGTPIWHQRAKWTGSAFTTYVPYFHTFIPEWGPSGMHVVGDLGSNNWYELNLNYFDDNGTDKKWVRALPHLYANGNRQFFGRMTLEMETGSTASLVTQPQIVRDYSDDRGNTFINPVSVGAGLSGATSQRVIWPSNGSSIDRIFRFSGVGQYRTTLINVDLDIEAGNI